MLDEIAVDLGRIDEMRHAEATAPFLLAVVDVDADDLVRADQLRALDDVESDAAKPEHDHVGARLDLCGIDHRADACRHTAADVAALVEGRVLADLRDRDFRQHGEVRESRATHIVENRLALVAEARRAVRHQALALCGADRGAQIGLAAEAAFTLAAFRRVERDHMIARLHRGHAGSHFADDAGALMAKDRGKNPLAVEPIERIGVGVADSGRLDLDQDFAGFRTFQVDFDDFQRLLRFETRRRRVTSFALLYPRFLFQPDYFFGFLINPWSIWRTAQLRHAFTASAAKGRSFPRTPDKLSRCLEHCTLTFNVKVSNTGKGCDAAGVDSRPALPFDRCCAVTAG